MTVTITLTSYGADVGPFDLYSDVDGYATPFIYGVDKSYLISGYTTPLVPDGTSVIRIQSTGDCTNYIDRPLIEISHSPSSSASNSISSSASSSVSPSIESFDLDIYFNYMGETDGHPYSGISDLYTLDGDEYSLIDYAWVFYSGYTLDEGNHTLDLTGITYYIDNVSQTPYYTSYSINNGAWSSWTTDKEIIIDLSLNINLQIRFIDTIT